MLRLPKISGSSIALSTVTIIYSDSINAQISPPLVYLLPRSSSTDNDMPMP